MRKIKVGTRQSQLALAQTTQIVAELQANHPDVLFEIVPFVTKGDRLQHVSLQKIGGKGVFVKEIEVQLLEGTIDMAVHSLKDVPSRLPEGCIVAAVPPRADVRDCMIFHQKNMSFEQLPQGAIVGTSSLRRQVQLKKMRPDLIIKPLRGNIDTRLSRVVAGEYDAIVLAMAGLSRLSTLKLSDYAIELLPIDKSIPAVAQGALGLECRSNDSQLRHILATVNDKKSAQCTQLERYFLSLMNGDCTFPIGAYARIEQEELLFDVMLASKDNERCEQLHYCMPYKEEETAFNRMSQQIARQAQDDLAQRGCFGGMDTNN